MPFIIDLNKFLVSYRKPCSNGKDWWYIVGYQVDGEMTLPKFIKVSENIKYSAIACLSIIILSLQNFV